MIRIFSILLLATLTTFGAFAQSQTIEKFEESADGYKLFMYQSVIRLLNQDKNPDFNKLIRDLDHLRLVTTETDEVDGFATFTSLDQSIQGEGFEEIMTFDNKEYKCHIYELDSNGGKTSWVATFYAEGNTGVIEMKGSLNLKYLNAFQSLNMDRLKEMLPLEGQEDWD